MPHVPQDGRFRLTDLPAVIHFLEAAFWDPDRVATTEQKMEVITYKTHVFSPYYAEFQVIAANLN